MFSFAPGLSPSCLSSLPMAVRFSQCLLLMCSFGALEPSSHHPPFHEEVKVVQGPHHCQLQLDLQPSLASRNSGPPRFLLPRPFRNSGCCWNGVMSVMGRLRQASTICSSSLFDFNRGTRQYPNISRQAIRPSFISSCATFPVDRYPAPPPPSCQRIYPSPRDFDTGIRLIKVIAFLSPGSFKKYSTQR